MPQEALKGTFVPFTDQDKIWKANVRRTMKNQAHGWPSRWSFLVDEYKKMYEALEGKRPLSPYDEEANARRPLAERIAELGKFVDKVYLPPIDKMPPSTSIPKTTSGWYGYAPKIGGWSLVTERQKWTKARPTIVQHDLIKLLEET
ncbi:uncharacterized protein [Littorina saxatilis]|uniref:Uncharacterized protein n=1 Tax=Littorina saxatilis TaxID=31220 RepID=A0AAN9BK35_9CAEN